MTTTRRRTGPYPRVPALCNECGTQREVAWRTICKGGRYKCATCRRQTSHAIVAPADWGDYWESQNRESKDARELQQLVSHIEGRSVYIWWNDDAAGGIADVRRYLEPIEMGGGREYTEFISIHPDLSVKEKVDALRWGWENLLPGAVWDKSVPIAHDTGDVFVGIYRTVG